MDIDRACLLAILTIFWLFAMDFALCLSNLPMSSTCFTQISQHASPCSESIAHCEQTPFPQDLHIPTAGTEL